jgi:hypothetical protein
MLRKINIRNFRPTLLHDIGILEYGKDPIREFFSVPISGISSLARATSD